MDYLSRLVEENFIKEEANLEFIDKLTKNNPELTIKDFILEGKTYAENFKNCIIDQKLKVLKKSRNLSFTLWLLQTTFRIIHRPLL
jgi:hypothetical protein